jgi:hypothetical protein
VKDFDSLKAFLQRFPSTGYSRSLQPRLDLLALERAEPAVLNNGAYKNLPDTLVSLTAYIAANPNASDAKLARQAREDVAVEQIRLAGAANRFVLPEVPVRSV